jgi:hypothetical protein
MRCQAHQPAPEAAGLYFYVSRETGDLVFLDRLPGTWSEQVQRQEQRKLRPVR